MHNDVVIETEGNRKIFYIDLQDRHRRLSKKEAEAVAKRIIRRMKNGQ
jgi:hypothetical protein